MAPGHGGRKTLATDLTDAKDKREEAFTVGVLHISSWVFPLAEIHHVLRYACSVQITLLTAGFCKLQELIINIPYISTTYM